MCSWQLGKWSIIIIIIISHLLHENKSQVLIIQKWQICKWNKPEANWQMVHLPSCQKMHITVNRTAQIYLELHFCVELHTKKALLEQVSVALSCATARHGIRRRVCLVLCQN